MKLNFMSFSNAELVCKFKNYLIEINSLRLVSVPDPKLFEKMGQDFKRNNNRFSLWKAY